MTAVPVVTLDFVSTYANGIALEVTEVNNIALEAKNYLNSSNIKDFNKMCSNIFEKMIGKSCWDYTWNLAA